MSLIYFGAGGVAPLISVALPAVLKSGSIKTSDGVYLPTQILISSTPFSIFFIFAAFGFFVANYKGLLYAFDVFSLAPTIPKPIFKSILTTINMITNFSVLAFSILDYQNFQTINTILYATFLISLILYFIILDLSNDRCFYTPSSIYWYADCTLLFLVIIHLTYSYSIFHYADISMLNTSTIFGYIVNILVFIRYSALYFEIKDRIIVFADETPDEDEDDDLYKED